MPTMLPSVIEIGWKHCAMKSLTIMVSTGYVSSAMMKRITHGARGAIKMHSVTGDIAALRHDLRNGPRHYFGLHNNCDSAFCQQKSNLSSGKHS